MTTLSIQMVLASNESAPAACLSPGTVITLADGSEASIERLPGTCCVSGLTKTGQPLSIPVTVVRYHDMGVLPGWQLTHTPKLALLSEYHMVFWKDEGEEGAVCPCSECNQFAVAGYRAATAKHMPAGTAERATNTGMYWYHLVPAMPQHNDCVFQLTGKYWSEFLRRPLSRVLSSSYKKWELVE
jgi:hypothetical protein